MSVFSKITAGSAVINGIKALSVGAVLAVGMLSIPVSAAPASPGNGFCNSCVEEQQGLQPSWANPYVRHPGVIYYPPASGEHTPSPHR